MAGETTQVLEENESGSGVPEASREPVHVVQAPVLNELQWGDWQDREWNRVQKLAKSEIALRREQGNQDNVLRRFRISGLTGYVVDVGCGAVPLIERISGNFVGIAIDSQIRRYQRILPIWQWRAFAKEARAEAIPLPSNSTHNVLCANVLPYVFDRAQALTEMIRILKPGGTLWLNYPIEGEGPTVETKVIDELLSELETERGERIEHPWSKQVHWYGIYRKVGK